jgi:hypothetical protein
MPPEFPVFDQQFNKLFPLAVQVVMRDSDEVISINDYAGNVFQPPLLKIAKMIVIISSIIVKWPVTKP